MPISLIGGVYKIISKFLANRLKLVLPSLITEFQGAFVDGRQITDGILIAAELIDARERFQILGMVVKVDLEKDFDNLNWKCLDVTMQRFGFGNVWRNWIHWCLSSVRFSMAINCQASSLFRSGKDVR
ncbi:uncharacterized protein LOC113306081 [Papaver somniferum]|uniref:uncharacterized protein LOC113306081 n=1 Tax=Papaver somniferum TaxID=3469 RepID=UPI000E701E08|nr:uncharacterized protein LOC113306081 [Papaver somniferum]